MATKDIVVIGASAGGMAEAALHNEEIAPETLGQQAS
jgi:protease II